MWPTSGKCLSARRGLYWDIVVSTRDSKDNMEEEDWIYEKALE